MSKEHTVCALLCCHWKSELLQEEATGWRTAGSACMGVRLMCGPGRETDCKELETKSQPSIKKRTAPLYHSYAELSNPVWLLYKLRIAK